MPNIFIGGKHLGGYSELTKGLKQGKVLTELKKAGVSHELEKLL